jgi:hypothetical protein
MGAPCFTRRVRSTPIPKGFKLPYDQQKYDGSQEPQSWRSDYLKAVRILGGSKETTMQSFQLHLTSAARSWLGKLERETIGSWDELKRPFTRTSIQLTSDQHQRKKSKLAHKSTMKHFDHTYNSGASLKTPRLMYPMKGKLMLSRVGYDEQI